MAARVRRLPPASLPSIRLSASVAEAVVVAVPTRPEGEGALLMGSVPVIVDGLLERESATGKPGEVVVQPVAGPAPLRTVLLVGVGKGDAAALRKAGAAVARRARSSASVCVDLRELPLDADSLRAFVEALLLASYGFSVNEAEPRPLTEVTLVVSSPQDFEPALLNAVTVARATTVARDLVNTPSLQKSPAWFADQAVGLLDGLTVRVRDAAELRAEGWGGVVAVGMGSSRPPCVVEARYDGGRRARRAPHVVLVGKGITFDTGGLSLKTNDGMLTMKMDMGGAAAVLATLRAVADLKLPISVTALAVVAENMPSGHAQRPSDVITQYGGTTVEVLNTDAEGRLVMADAIAYADRTLQADVIVDVATLTGAMPVALGKKMAGLFASSDDLAGQLLAAADVSGEPLWRLPLVADYRPALDSTVADMRNIANPRLKLGAGSITAALFLQEFAGDRAWAHLDIAGPAWSGSDEDEFSKGGTGFGVRLLVRWLETLAASA